MTDAPTELEQLKGWSCGKNHPRRGLVTAENRSGWFIASHSAPMPDERPTTARWADAASVRSLASTSGTTVNQVVLVASQHWRVDVLTAAERGVAVGQHGDKFRQRRILGVQAADSSSSDSAIGERLSS